MNKIKTIFLIVLTFLLFPITSYAATGTINVTGTQTALVGNRITLTVTLSSNTGIGSWQMDLNYDKSYLQLVSTTAEAGSNKMSGATPTVNGVKTKSYTYTFKTLKSGSTRVSVSNYLVYSYDEKEMDITSSGKTIRIMTQDELEATYSKNNDLKSLSVEGFELDKPFDKDTLEYKVDVPTGTTSVKINASVSDNTASASGTGEIEVTEGTNTIPIIVTAQNGDQKTYTIIVNVEDLNPIKVQVSDKEYVVVKNASLLTAPETFTSTTIKINDFDIPAFINNTANITLVGLKDEGGIIDLYQYKDNAYLPFNKMNLNTYLLLPTEFTQELDLIKTTIKIDDISYPAYKYSENTDYVIISAKSLTDGKTDLYLYDPINGSAIRFDDTYLNEANKTINNYAYVIIAFGGILGVMLIIILSLIISLRKKQKKINKFLQKQEAKIEATRRLNDVIDEVKKITESENYTKDKDNKENKNKEENKENKENKDKEDTVKIKQINTEETTKPDKENDKKTENSENPGPDKKENNSSKNNDEEVYDLFGDDKKHKKKKK